jgi:hypothetical protein
MENCVGRSMSLAWLLYVIQWINNGTLSSTGIDMNVKPSQKRYRVFYGSFSHSCSRRFIYVMQFESDYYPMLHAGSIFGIDGSHTCCCDE